MSKKPPWVTAETYREFIDDIVEGALKEFKCPESLSGLYDKTEYEDGFTDIYDADEVYANPYHSIKFFPDENGIPENMGSLLRESDSIYSAVAKATAQSIEQVAEKPGLSVGPDGITKYTIGIMTEIASRLQVRQATDQSAYVVVNEPLDGAEIHY